MTQQPGLFRVNAAQHLKISEADVLNYALDRLAFICCLIRINSGGVIEKQNRYQRKDGSVKEYNSWIKLAPKGTSDLIGYHRRNGLFVAIECKDHDGKTDPLQDFFLDGVKHARAYAFVVHSTEEVDIVAKFLEREGM